MVFNAPPEPSKWPLGPTPLALQALNIYYNYMINNMIVISISISISRIIIIIIIISINIRIIRSIMAMIVILRPRRSHRSASETGAAQEVPTSGFRKV